MKLQQSQDTKFPQSTAALIVRCCLNSVQPVCELLPQALSLHIVDVLIAVGGVNDLGTGINKGINLFAFQCLYRSLNRLMPMS